MDLGDLPTWLGALISLLALLAAAAAAAARQAGRLLGLESGRDDDAARERRQGQARRVAAWVAVTIDASGGRSDGFVLDNASDAPVHDVDIAVLAPEYKGWRNARLRIVPPGRYLTSDGEPTYCWHFPDDVDAFTGTVRPVMKKDDWRVSTVLCTDSAGVRWSRDGMGLLEEVGGR